MYHTIKNNTTMFKLNNADNYESIGTIKLTKEQFPVAYNNKLQELIEMGLSEEEAASTIDSYVFELEIYYDKGYGLFAVETDAVDAGADIHSPYTGDLGESADE